MAGGCAADHSPPAAAVSATIVSLNPCSDAVLAQVADPARIAGLSHYSFDPVSSSMDVAVARRFRAVGPSVEEVLALHPRVVIAGTFLPPATAQAIEAQGIRLIRLPIARSVAEARVQVRTIAALAGRPASGEALVARIDAALAAARPPAGAAPVSTIVWQSGGIVPGEGTLIADLLAQTGFVSLSAQRGMGQATHLPLEAMLADPPEVILAAGDQLSEEDRLLSHPALARLSGTIRARFDPSLLWCGGPSIPRAVARLAEVRSGLTLRKPLPLAGGVWGGQVPRAARAAGNPPPTPPASGRRGI